MIEYGKHGKNPFKNCPEVQKELKNLHDHLVHQYDYDPKSVVLAILQIDVSPAYLKLFDTAEGRFVVNAAVPPSRTDEAFKSVRALLIRASKRIRKILSEKYPEIQQPL